MYVQEPHEVGCIREKTQVDHRCEAPVRSLSSEAPRRLTAFRKNTSDKIEDCFREYICLGDQ